MTARQIRKLILLTTVFGSAIGCTGIILYTHFNRKIGIPDKVRIDMCLNMCTDMCLDICIDMCTSMCIGICIGMCDTSTTRSAIEPCALCVCVHQIGSVSVRTRVCTWCAHMHIYTYIYMHVCRYACRHVYGHVHTICA